VGRRRGASDRGPEEPTTAYKCRLQPPNLGSGTGLRVCVETGGDGVSYQGTTSVVPGAAFPPVGFSRCRPKNHGLKALGHKPLRSARLKACPDTSISWTLHRLLIRPIVAVPLPSSPLLLFPGRTASLVEVPVFLSR
jgi:hypothetical protein